MLNKKANNIHPQTNYALVNRKWKRMQSKFNSVVGWLLLPVPHYNHHGIDIYQRLEIALKLDELFPMQDFS